VTGEREYEKWWTLGRMERTFW